MTVCGGWWTWSWSIVSYSCTVVVVVNRVRCCWVRLYSCFLGSSDFKEAFWVLVLFLAKLLNFS